MRILTVALVLAACAPRSASPPSPPPPSTVVLFFPDGRATNDVLCNAVAPARRAVARPDADAVLRALFAGPTAGERAAGLADPFTHPLAGAPDAPLAASYRGVEVRGRTAYVSFQGAAMAYLNAAICAQAEVKASIEKTLRARGIDDVRYVVDGVEVTEWDA
jgi:hypothetical protein